MTIYADGHPPITIKDGAKMEKIRSAINQKNKLQVEFRNDNLYAIKLRRKTI